MKGSNGNRSVDGMKTWVPGQWFYAACSCTVHKRLQVGLIVLMNIIMVELFQRFGRIRLNFMYTV